MQLHPNPREELIQRVFRPLELPGHFANGCVLRISGESQFPSLARQLFNAPIQSPQLPSTQRQLLSPFVDQKPDDIFRQHQPIPRKPPPSRKQLVPSDQTSPRTKRRMVIKRRELPQSRDADFLHHVVHFLSLRAAGPHKRPQLRLMPHPQPQKRLMRVRSVNLRVRLISHTGPLPLP